MKRWIEGLMVSVFAVMVLALAFPAWAQDVVAAVVAPVAGLTMGWDAIFLTVGGILLTALTRKILPDDVEVKWIPVVAHVWSLAGTFTWKAIQHQVSWHSAGLIAAQAILQAVIASGILTHGSYAGSIVTAVTMKTLRDD